MPKYTLSISFTRGLKNTLLLRFRQVSHLKFPALPNELFPCSNSLNLRCVLLSVSTEKGGYRFFGNGDSIVSSDRRK